MYSLISHVFYLRSYDENTDMVNKGTESYEQVYYWLAFASSQRVYVAYRGDSLKLYVKQV